MFLKLVYSKNYSNLANIFVLRLSKTEWSRLEQTSVIIFLVAEKCKPGEISEKCM